MLARMFELLSDCVVGTTIVVAHVVLVGTGGGVRS
jgi:hypothetical protein